VDEVANTLKTAYQKGGEGEETDEEREEGRKEGRKEMPNGDLWLAC